MWKQTTKVRVLFVLAIAVFSGVAFSSHTYAGTGINQQLAFEGKIVNSDGTNPTNATYNMEFKIYNGGTGTGGGTLQWTEDELVGGTGGVPLTNGTFEINLGANTALSSVNWNSDTLWLSIQVGNTSSCTITTTFQSNCGGDGEMTPYIRLTAVPYAFNALDLGGVAASGYGTLAGTQTWAAGNTFSSSLTANGITFASGGLNLNSGGITSAGSIAGVSTLGLTGAITGATATNTINGLIINSGALSGITGVTFTSGGLALNSGGITAAGSIAGVSTLGLTGAITGATSTNTINGLIINSGALSGVSTITTSGAINGITVGSTITPSAAGALTIQANGSNILGFATGTTGSAINFGNTTSNPTIGFTGSGTFGTTTGAVSLNGPTTVTGTNAFTVNNALTTLGGGLTFSGTTARTIQGPGTGGLTETVTSGPLTLSTVTSGTLAVTSAGALNLTGAAASTFTTGGNSLTITSSNFNVSNVGAITAATTTNTLNGLIVNSGALSGVTTLGLSGAITGATSGNTINGVIINGGAVSGVTSLGLSGAITGATSGNTINGIIINGGAVSGATTIAASGAITAATSGNTLNGLIVNAGALSGITTIATSGAINGVTIASGAVSGVTTLAQTLSTNTNNASAHSLSVTNTNNTGTATTVNGESLTLVGTASGTNTINGLNFNNVTTIAGNTFNGLNFGTGYTNGLNFTSATGVTDFINTPTADLTSGGALTGLTGISFTSGALALNSGGISAAGTIAGVTGYTQGSGTFGVTGTSSFTGTTTVNTGTADQLLITSGANIPGVDQLAITNTGSSGVTAAGVNGLSIAYKGGAAAIEAAAERIDLTPGTTSGGTWSGIRVVPAATGAVSGVTENGVKIDNLTTPGSGTENAINVGTGWDNVLQSANTTITQSGAITTAGLATLNGGISSSSSLTIDATGALNLGPTNATSIVLGGNTSATIDEQVANSSTTAYQLETAGNTALLSADTTNDKLQVGSGTADTTEITLQLDSYSTFTDSGSCTTTSNQGALYYNTASAAIRACVNGAWEDAVTTSGLGILAFGVIPDSANAGTPGDIAGVSNYSKSPCKVVWTATQQVTVEPCLAYSGGRKIIIPSTALSTASLAANTFSNVCLTAAGGQPALGTGSTTETSAAQPTFSANNPVLCLATVKTSGTAGNVGFIWDTRTFTNTEKEFATINSVNDNGFLVIGTTTFATAQTTATAATGPVRGVVVATTGTASTTVVNAIITVQGPAFVQFVSGGTATINNYLESTTTAGYGTSVAAGGAVSNYIYGGLLQTSISTSCTTTNTLLSACQYAPLVDFRPSR